MNRLISGLLLVFLFIFSVIKAQSDTLKNPEQFLFPEFLKGKIGMKSGKDVEMMINYNILSEKIVFVQNGKILGLGNTSSVDTIFVGKRIFIPAGKMFFEIMSEPQALLFIQYKGIVQTPPKMDPYGRTSEAASITSVSSVKVGREFYTLTDQEMIIKKETVYWVRFNESMESFRDATQFIKLFPDFKSEIKAYIKQNKIKFGSTEQVLKLLAYSSGLIKNSSILIFPKLLIVEKDCS